MERPFLAGQPLISHWKGSKVPSFPLFCLSVHQIFKSMPPGKLLRCNSKTLPFPLPESGHRAGFWPGEGQEAGWTSWPEWGCELARVGCPSRWTTTEDKSLKTSQRPRASLSGPRAPQALHTETSLGSLGCLGKARRSDFNTCICSVKWGAGKEESACPQSLYSKDEPG